MYHLRSDPSGAKPCTIRALQAQPAGTAQQSVAGLCPMHGYLVGLREVSRVHSMLLSRTHLVVSLSRGVLMSWQKSDGAALWNTTTTRERWPLLLGESQERPQALAWADGCAAALSGGSEWLLLSSPATAAAERSEDGAAAWELSLQRSSLPFRHVAWDLQGMSMAVGAGVIVVSIGWHVHRLRSRRTSDQTVDAVSLSVSVCCSVLSRSFSFVKLATAGC